MGCTAGFIFRPTPARHFIRKEEEMSEITEILICIACFFYITRSIADILYKLLNR